MGLKNDNFPTMCVGAPDYMLFSHFSSCRDDQIGGSQKYCLRSQVLPDIHDPPISKIEMVAPTHFIFFSIPKYALLNIVQNNGL